METDSSMKVLNTRTDYGDCDSAMKALHRWPLTITTITLASAGQHWTGTPWFADVEGKLILPGTCRRESCAEPVRQTL